MATMFSLVTPAMSSPARPVTPTAAIFSFPLADLDSRAGAIFTYAPSAKALEAASYAAYATVYAQGGAAAVADRAAFEPEFCWQLASLTALAECPAYTEVLIP